MKKHPVAKNILSWIISNQSLNHEKAIKTLKEKIYPAILLSVRDHEIAQDLFQELCVLCWEKIRSETLIYHGEEAFWRYLHTTWKRWWYAYYKEQLPYFPFQN